MKRIPTLFALFLGLPPPSGGSRVRQGATLIELLAVAGVVVLLLSLLLPAISVLRQHARTVSARGEVAQLSASMQCYQDESPLHLFPTPAVDGLLDEQPGSPGAVLEQLALVGFQVPRSALSLTSAPPRAVLQDPWRRPYYYQLDGPRLTATGIDSSTMNGPPQRPAPRQDWNPEGLKPYAYIWCLGRPSGLSLADDQQPAHAGRWIYYQAGPHSP